MSFLGILSNHVLRTGRASLYSEIISFSNNCVRKMHYNEALMCSPDHFVVGELINPWMGGVVDKSKAVDQWNALKSALELAGVQVHVIEQTEGLPDMVFSCNSGLARAKKVYLSHFRHKARQAERNVFREWYENNGFTVLGKDDYDFFEGGGDCVFASPGVLVAGYGFRTSKDVYSKMNGLADFKVLYCKLVNEKFYHLDTCFCPLNDKQAIYYPAAFDKESVQLLKDNFDLIEIDEDEALKFACNALPVPQSKTVIAPKGCPKMSETLQSLGFKYIEVDMSEFMKSGGACQCLVMKLHDK